MTTATRLWALDAPTVDLDASEMVIGAEGTVTFPLPAFLIEHERGLVLFDTSIAPFFNDDPVAYLGPDLAEVLNVQTTPDKRIDRQLAKLGFRTEDITHVILSHTHFDHAGGLYLFPQAKFLRGPHEFEWASSPMPGTEHLFRYDLDLAPTEGFDWTTMTGPQLDYFGDGSITVFHTPGHSPGELSLKVKLPTQTIVLTGDTVHLREAYDRVSPDPHDWDLEASRRSIRQLKSLEEAGARIWIGHDPGDWIDFGGPLKALS